MFDKLDQKQLIAILGKSTDPEIRPNPTYFYFIFKEEKEEKNNKIKRIKEVFPKN